MPNVYRVYRLDPVTSKIASPADILDVSTDEQAIAAARELLDGKDIEIWRGDRLIKRLRHTDCR